MTKDKLDCFFISPIKEKDSGERRNSNHVIYQIIEPVLSQFGFNTNKLRSDQATTPSITNEMLRRLKDDELCIADLSDLNPNVLWEYGYRYATGKPIIALIARGHGAIPFDIRDVRVIEYEYFSSENNINAFDPENLKRTRETLTEHLRYYVDNNFCASETVSISLLQSIERLLSDINSKVTVSPKSIDALNNPEELLLSQNKTKTQEENKKNRGGNSNDV